MAIDDVLAERQQRYGEFSVHAQITQDLKRVMLGSPNWAALNASKKEALEMVAHKIGRILNGDPEYDDSWVDISGYVSLVVRELHADQARKSVHKRRS